MIDTIGSTGFQPAHLRRTAAIETVAQALIALCACMVLVPVPHILNGAIDLARTRVALGIARLTYAGLILLMIC